MSNPSKAKKSSKVMNIVATRVGAPLFIAFLLALPTLLVVAKEGPSHLKPMLGPLVLIGLGCVILAEFFRRARAMILARNTMAYDANTRTYYGYYKPRRIVRETPTTTTTQVRKLSDNERNALGDSKTAPAESSDSVAS